LRNQPLDILSGDFATALKALIDSWKSDEVVVPFDWENDLALVVNK